MPAVSKAQQRFMGMVYATKKGEMTNPSPEVAKAAASMKKKGNRMVPNCVPKEELSIDQQMKIARDHNRKSPEEKKAANMKVLGAVKKVKREKDTRTDAQKMTDATGPRPGSRYRGD